MVCESPPASVTYSNHCNKAGYYSDCIAPFTYQNSTCYNWTNAGDCGSYHVNNTTGCHQNVAHNNWADNRNWSNSPACGTNTSSCSFGNSCAWGGDYSDCDWTNSCVPGGYSDYDTTSHCVPCTRCQGSAAYCQAGYSDGWSDGSCSDWCNNGSGGSGGYQWSDSCCSVWEDTVHSNWPDSCASGYSDSCGSWYDAPGDSCYSGYPNSCYYYADHNNSPPFNNFCNHSNVNN